MSKRKLIQSSCLVICHGKSEYIMIQNTKSILRLTLIPYARNNGDQCIQLKSLLAVLNEHQFKTKKNFRGRFNVDLEGRNPIKFKVFTIIDLDEPENTKNDIENYKNKSMFKNHWMYDYIVPIFNDPNLDIIFNKLGYSIDTSSKVASYQKMFSLGKNDKMFYVDLLEKLNKSNNTNLHEFFDYILSPIIDTLK